MPQEIELPDGSIAEFPDGMSTEDITAVLRREFPQQEPGINRFSQSAVSQLGAFADIPGMGELGREMAETSVLPEGQLTPQSNVLGQLEQAGLTQPGAMERTDFPSTLGRAAITGLFTGGGSVPALGMETAAAATSALGEVAGREVGGPMGALAGSFLGGMAPSTLSGFVRRSALGDVEALGEISLDQMIETGKEIGLPVQIGDLTPEGRALGALTGRVPLTGARNRAGKRIAKARRAAGSLVDESIALMNRTGWDNIETIQRIAKGKGARAADAQNILRAIGEAGDDLDTIIAVSGKISAFKAKLQADKLYDEVSRLAGDARVRPSNTAKEIMQQAQRLNVGPGQDEAAIGYLRDLFGKFNQKGPMTLDELRRARSAILGQARRLGAGNTVTDEGRRAINNVAEAIWDDLIPAATASGNPIAVSKLKQANKFYRNVYLPMRDGQLAKAINKTDLGDPGNIASRELDEIANSFLSHRKGMRAARTFDLLENKGKAAVKARIYSQAFEKATLRSDVGNAVFSPAQFAQALENWGPFLSKVSNLEVRGLAKVFRATARGAGPGSTVDTGGRAADLLTAGAVFSPAALFAGGDPTTTIAGGAVTAFSARVLQAFLESEGAVALLSQAAKETSQQRLTQLGARMVAIGSRGQGDDRGSQ